MKFRIGKKLKLAMIKIRYRAPNRYEIFILPCSENEIVFGFIMIENKSTFVLYTRQNFFFHHHHDHKHDCYGRNSLTHLPLTRHVSLRIKAILIEMRGSVGGDGGLKEEKFKLNLTESILNYCHKSHAFVIGIVVIITFFLFFNIFRIYKVS